MADFDDINEFFALDQNPDGEVIILDGDGVGWIVRLLNAGLPTPVLRARNFKGASAALGTLPMPFTILSPEFHEPPPPVGPDTCPACRHAFHADGVCYNMASDNDCDCKGVRR